ncbi:unnamed protein product [Linum tenue]|uniref:NAC domain-containing protein n=1 Tax=Linum tenue TaxID=586396 RepID=A0AAV0GWW8_9ROSI|nr:unnamed protein product [Linum tenue]
MPGFRFHPTEEELVEFYLRRKVEGKRFNVELITFLDLYRYDPWELPGSTSPMAAIGEKEWFFYVPRDRKYRNGDRPNRVTTSGYWKATGADRMIRTESSRSIGLKKTLVFYSGKAPKGIRTSWIMNEYRLPHHDTQRYQKTEISLCRVYKRAGVEDHHGGPSLPRSLPSTRTPHHHHHHHQKQQHLGASTSNSSSSTSNKHHHHHHLQQQTPQYPQLNLQQPFTQVLMDVDKLTSSSSTSTATLENTAATAATTLGLLLPNHMITLATTTAAATLQAPAPPLPPPPPPDEVVADEQFLILSGSNPNNSNDNNNSNTTTLNALDDLHRLVNFQQQQQQYYTSLLQQQQQQQQMMFLPPPHQQMPSFSNSRSPLQIWEWNNNNNNVVPIPPRPDHDEDHQANDNDRPSAALITWD